MAADADRPLCMKPSFPLCGSSLVVKHLTIAAKHAIRDQLLERWILLHLWTRPVTGILRIQNHFQIAIDVVAKALKVADLMKDGSGDDKDVFNRHFSSLQERVFKRTAAEFTSVDYES
jgi:hypothetical protein